MIARLRAWLSVQYVSPDVQTWREAERKTAEDAASCVVRHAQPDHSHFWRMAEDKARRRTLRRVS